MAVDTRAHTKTLPEPGRKRSLAQKAYQIVNKFSGDVGGAQPLRLSATFSIR